MMEYYDQLEQAEQEAATEVVRLLNRQTFLLEKKFVERRQSYVSEGVPDLL